jgi:26S proteasome regulatory subunit N7
MEIAFTGETKVRKGPTKQWSEGEVEAELKKLDDKITDARENQGEIEVRDAIVDKAEFLRYEAEDFVRAEKIFREAYDLTGGASRKMELLFECLLINFEKQNINSIKKDIDVCLKLVDDGADWDKKNKLKIYEAVYCMMIRDFKKASDLLVTSIATFTALEVMPFKDFIFYTVVLALLTQDRKVIKKEIIHCPDILAVNREIPHLKEFGESFYSCDYQTFIRCFIEICEQVKSNKYLKDHAFFYTKEMRLVAYKQYLESFKSVTISNMATAFGVSAEFIDRELSTFIYNGKLNCKIDKVSGVIESNRPNRKAELFQQTVHKGDALLNRIQKLARGLDI